MKTDCLLWLIITDRLLLQPFVESTFHMWTSYLSRVYLSPKMFEINSTARGVIFLVCSEPIGKVHKIPPPVLNECWEKRRKAPRTTTSLSNESYLRFVRMNSEYTPVICRKLLYINNTLMLTRGAR